MSRNILVLLIMGALTFGFIKPNSSSIPAKNSQFFLKDSNLLDSLKKDTLISDSARNQKIGSEIKNAIILAKAQLEAVINDTNLSEASSKEIAINQALATLNLAKAKLDSFNSLKDPIALVEKTKVAEKPKGTVIFGTASYYHNMFIGRPTATGDIFKQTKMTCAHRTIPLKSWVRVTRMDNGKSVVLYVNDRMGKSPHEIDLTTTAAKKLGYIHAGWTKVKIEVIPKP